jgi:hypothetical protein
MNQSILFSDDPCWHEQLNQIWFSAQCQGALIVCIVHVSLLERLAGKSLDDTTDPLSLFSQYRFDIEDLAEELIEAEQFDTDGNLSLC